MLGLRQNEGIHSGPGDITRLLMCARGAVVELYTPHAGRTPVMRPAPKAAWKSIGGATGLEQHALDVSAPSSTFDGKP